MALLLVLIFAAEVFAQQSGSPQATPGVSPHYGPGISDTTLIVRQGTYARFHVTWWTYKKEEEIPLENYTVEIEHIRNGKGAEIPLPQGMEFTYYVWRDPEREPPNERKAPYNTYIQMQINTTTDTPTGTYVLSLRSKGYGEFGGPAALVVIDKESAYVPCNR
jgi:hypothetical protein